MQIEHILVATDLSSEARLAYAHAAALAERLGARVTLFHVTERVDLSFLPTHELVRHAEEVAQRAGDQLQEEAKYFVDRGLPVTLQTAAGRPAEEIISFVEREDIDLCVLTRRGESRHKFLVGSTATRVLRHIAVPLMLVPPLAGQEEAEAPAFKGYRHLLTTTDYSEDSRRGLRAAVSLAEQFAAEMTLVHVTRIPGGLVRSQDLPDTGQVGDVVTWLREHHDAKLRTEVEAVGTERVPIDVVVGIDNSPSAGIVATATSVGADLITVPSHGKGTFRAVLVGSTSERVLKLSRVPVLVMARDWLEGQGD